MNPSTALARVLVDELVRGGVREAVLAPGSRSAPLSFALHAADGAGRLRLHVRIDERTAGFLALGLAKGSGAPVPVVTTSGTAAANLHPAVLEADQAGVPLLVLTADRPPELRGSGANQTVDQIKLYGAAVRRFHELGAPEHRSGQNAGWRALTCRSLAAAAGTLSADPGPVHLNLALREPLTPDADDSWVESLDGRAGGAAWTTVAGSATAAIADLDDEGPPRTLVVVGDCSAQLATRAVALARSRGWPLVAEIVSPAAAFALPAGLLLLSAPDFLARHRPERVLVVGRTTLSRAVGALLRAEHLAVDVVTDGPRWSDPGAVAQSARRPGWSGPGSTLAQPRLAGAPAGPSDWLAGWEQAAAAAARALESLLDISWEPPAAPSGLHVARAMLRCLPDAPPGSLLVLGSSSAVRDADLVGAGLLRRLQVLANRGAAGIDGTVSTAVGAALARQRLQPVPAYALMGDLTFVHDANGLVIGPGEPRPDLTIVVLNDDGGGIFALLEPGQAQHAAAFERVFGTPHGVDIRALCAATRTPHELVDSPADLPAALEPSRGLRVVEVRTDRSTARDVHARVRAAVAEALR